MIGAAPAQRYNVSLPPEVAEALRKAGGNNLSAGIRFAAKSLALVGLPQHCPAFKERTA